MREPKGSLFSYGAVRQPCLVHPQYWRVGGDFNLIRRRFIMKNQIQKAPQFNGWDSVTINLNILAKIEQAELIAKFAINSNASRDDALVAISCIADLLYDVLVKAK